MNARKQPNFAGNLANFGKLTAIGADLIFNNQVANCLLNRLVCSFGNFALAIREVWKDPSNDLFLEFVDCRFASGLIRVLDGSADFGAHLLLDGIQDLIARQLRNKAVLRLAAQCLEF